MSFPQSNIAFSTTTCNREWLSENKRSSYFNEHSERANIETIFLTCLLLVKSMMSSTQILAVDSAQRKKWPTPTRRCFREGTQQNSMQLTQKAADTDQERWVTEDINRRKTCAFQQNRCHSDFLWFHAFLFP